MARTIDIPAIGKLLGYTEAQTRSIMSVHISGNEHRVYVDRRIASHHVGSADHPEPRGYQYDRHGQTLVFTESFPYENSVPLGEVKPEYKVLSRAAAEAIFEATE